MRHYIERLLRKKSKQISNLPLKSPTSLSWKIIHFENFSKTGETVRRILPREYPFRGRLSRGKKSESTTGTRYLIDLTTKVVTQQSWPQFPKNWSCISYTTLFRTVRILMFERSNVYSNNCGFLFFHVACLVNAENSPETHSIICKHIGLIMTKHV